MRGDCGGIEATAASVAPDETASENARGACGSRSASFESTRLWKIAPSAATPVAMPTWRNVELIPEAMPARAGSTTPIATAAIPGFVIPIPMPEIRKPGQQHGPAVADLEAVHEDQADADEQQPRAHQHAMLHPALREAGGDRGDDEREQRQRQEPQAGLER